MKYRLLGNSGLRVSEMSLGTMNFGELLGWCLPKDEARKIYETYRSAGGNFIDTANIYTNGEAETMVGEFMQGHRHEMVLATKYTGMRPGNDANAAGNHRKSMVRALEGSLRRLKTDYIDIYWLHLWDRMTPVEEVMRAFDDLVCQGKVLYIGVSDAPAWWVAQGNTIADLRGWSKFIGLQIEYSLMERTVERELIPMAKAFNLGLIAWSPLAGGLLSGKYHTGKAAKGRYSEMLKSLPPAKRARLDRIVETLKKVSGEVGRPPAYVALAWLRYRDVPVIPVIGASRVSQVDDNLASLDLKLSSDQVAQLDQASAIELGFPYELYEMDQIVSLVYGGMRDKILTT
jgi:aryl-alcohol dehydrogenase-like predicted oxidoreductase